LACNFPFVELFTGVFGFVFVIVLHKGKVPLLAQSDQKHTGGQHAKGVRHERGGSGKAQRALRWQLVTARSLATCTQGGGMHFSEMIARPQMAGGQDDQGNKAGSAIRDTGEERRSKEIGLARLLAWSHAISKHRRR
jgi:hypothetical protein